MKGHSLIILYLALVGICGEGIEQKKPQKSLKQIKSFLEYLGTDETEHRVYFISKSDSLAKTFDESRNICNKLGLRLVSMDSKIEQDWLLQTLDELKDLHYGFYIGVTRDANNTWNRIENRGVIDFDLNFHSGEPNNQFESEDCIELSSFYYQKHFKLNDIPCTERKHFVCVLDQ